MAQELCVIVSAEDRTRLAAIIDDRNRPLKHIQRAQIVLFSAERLPVLQVAHRAGVSRPAVWRWQKRYAEAGVEGLLRDKTRPPGRKPVPTATVAKVLALTQGKPFGEATHWTGRAMAKAVGLSLRTVQRIWETHRLQPHRIRTFKRSNDPAFAEKVEDVIGLYMHPPAHAVVLSIDEKSQIQALDRTQPGLPIKPGRCGTMTHDYKRHGTTTLFAALNTLDGVVLGRCMQRHRHRSSSASSMLSSAQSRPVSWSTPFSTITPAISIQRSKPGLPGTPVGPSTSLRSRAPGSMPSKASSPSSPASASGAASSNPSLTFRPPSTATSTSNEELDDTATTVYEGI
jgi:transposase